MLWSWVDLDVKRLEPWYQLSSSNGASAYESLLLHYPVDFLAVVPFQSAKRHQWAVVCASTIMVLVFWAVTPLQSGIFATSLVQKVQPLQMAVSDQLLSPSEQTNVLTLNFLNDAYGVAWLGQSLPAFTTQAYALAPFTPVRNHKALGTNTTWTSSTTLYSTDLDCHPAEVTGNMSDLAPLTFHERNSCATQNLTLGGGRPGLSFSGYFVGYHNDREAAIDPSLKQAGCSQSVVGEFLAIWQRSNDRSFPTALFCEASYYSQQVQATVTVPNFSVKRVTPSGPKTSLSSDKFNITHFEYILGTGALPSSPNNVTSFQQDIPNRHDISDETVIDQSFQLNNEGIWGVSNMVGFAVGTSRLPPEDFLDPSKMHDAFQEAHQLLFALAVHSVVQSPSASAASVTALENYFVNSVVMVETFTIIVQVLLFVIVIFTTYLLVFVRRRNINLCFDPNCLAFFMALTHNRPKFLEIFQALDLAKSTKYHEKFQGLRFNLRLPAQGFQSVFTVRVDGTQGGSGGESENSSEKPLSRASSRVAIASWPVELTWPVGATFVFLLGGALAAVVLLKRQILKQNGK